MIFDRTRGTGAALLLCVTMLLHGGPLPAAEPHRLPELGDRSSSTVSAEMEREIGEQLLRQVRAQMPTEDDPLLKYYTEIMLYRLAEHSQLQQRELSMVLIDSPQINAFAAPGGIVGINVGLYLTAQDVHEFSGVLAHELAHLSQRHFARTIEAQQRQSIPFLAAMLASIAMAATGSDLGIAGITATQAASQMNQLRHSRTFEQEADRIGIRTMAAAELDPQGMAGMFQRMQRAHRFSTRPPEFLLTHPVTESRIADTRGRAVSLADREYEDSEEFQLMRARAMIRHTNSAGEAVQQFRGMVERTAGNEKRHNAAQYGLALALAENGETVEAIEQLRPLFERRQSSIIYAASYAELLLEAGRPEQALTVIDDQLRRHPENKPLSVIKAQALSRAGEHVEAKEILQRLSRRHPNDHDLWFELAETAGLAGDIIQVHQARAEYFLRVGNIRQAIQHLDYARGLVGEDDFQLEAQLAQRIRELRETLASQRGESRG